jgi:hypothetical protein
VRVAVGEDLDVEIEAVETGAQILNVHLGALTLGRLEEEAVVDDECKADLGG